MSLCRKAIIFSMISVLISGFIILLFWSVNAPRLDVMTDAARTRVTVMDRHLTNWDAFTRDAAQLATRGILQGMTNNIDSGDEPVTLENVKNNITHCLRIGMTSYMLDGGEAFCYGSVDSSLFAHLDKYEAFVQDELGIETSYEVVQDLAVDDYAPFEINVTFGIRYVINDTFASWNRTVYYNIIVNVEGLEDPLFRRYGPWNLPSAPYRNITQFYIPRDRLNESDVADLIDSREYVSNENISPTYLERLTLNLSLDFDKGGRRAGIETLIIPDEVNSADKINKSFVGHQIFADLNFTCGNKTLAFNRTRYPYIPDDFRLDVPHVARYGFNGSEGMLDYSCG